MIFEQKCFVNERGESINGRYAMVGLLGNIDDMKTLPGPAFFAVAILNMPLPGGQTAQTQFQFDIPGATPEEAFENLPAAMEAGRVKAEAELRRQISGQNLIVPGGVPGPGLPGLRHNRRF